jgi:hypothetical protein
MREREQNIFDGNGNAGMGTTFSFTGMGTGNGKRESRKVVPAGHYSKIK